MKIYIVHEDALKGSKNFREFTDEEIVKLAESDPLLIDVYDNVENMATDWNNDNVFYPGFSYMRVIND